MPTEAPPPVATSAAPPADAPEQPAASVPGGLPLHFLAEPLRGQIEWVQRRHGLTPAAASLTVLATVLCVCGPSHRIENSIDTRSLPPALSLVLYGCPAAYIQAAVGIGLDPIRQWMLLRIGPPDKSQLRRARLRLGELHQERIAKEFHINSAGVSSQTPGSEWGGALKESELAAHRKILEDEHAKILREISNLTFLLRPHLLVDDAALPRLLEPGHLCTDGAVFHTSSGGHAVPAWTGANTDTKVELARLLNLAWHGLPDAGDEDCHVRPLLSNLLVVDPTAAGSLWADRGLSGAGVLRHLFFMEAGDGDAEFDPQAVCPPETDKLWTEGLTALLGSRLAGGTINHHLDGSATEIFEAFAREIWSKAYDSEPEEARRLERTPVLALKLALLVHAISPDQKEKAVGAKTVEFACALAAAVSVADLQFVNRVTSSAATPTGTPDEVAVTKLVAKLRLRGPLPWRLLLRSNRDQKAAPFRHLLEKAIAAGLVRKEGALFQAIEPA